MTVGAQRTLGRSGRLALVGIVVAGAFLGSTDSFTLGVFLAYVSVGAYLVARRPNNAIGWLLICISFGFIATTTAPNLDVAALARGDATPRDELLSWLSGGWTGWSIYLAFLALTIVFPSGRVSDGRGRRGDIILLVVGVAVVVATAVAPTMSINVDGVTTIDVPNPVAVLPDLPIWTDLPMQDGSVLLMLLLLLIGGVRLVLRYRRETGIVRLQLRWLAAAVAFVLMGLLIAFASLAIFGDAIGAAVWIPVVIAYPTIPLAIGVAVMRYRLFEIDRIISRTLGYAIVTGILLVVFSGVILLLQGALERFTQGSTIAVAASTLAVFALFQPLRRRVQSVVDRRFDRARYDGERTVAAFGVRLRDEVEMDTVTSDLAHTAQTTVAPTWLTIWLRARSADR